jgi:hypothetical protein
MKLFLSLFILIFLLACGGSSGSGSGESHQKDSYLIGTFFQAFPRNDPSNKELQIVVYTLYPDKKFTATYFIFLDADFNNGNYEKGYYRQDIGTFSNGGSSYTFNYSSESCPPAAGSETFNITSDFPSDHIYMDDVQFISLVKYRVTYKQYTDLIDPNKQTLIFANNSNDCPKFNLQ